MNFSNGPFSIIFLQIVALAFWLIPADIQAADSLNCMECHKEYADGEFRKTFIHKPFLQQNCRYCHSPDWVDKAAESDGKAQFPKKTKKLGSGDNLAQIHLFSIPKELEPNMLFIEAKNGINETFKTKLRIPPFDTIKTVLSDATPPEINKVQVIEVERSNLVTAKISWETDKLASASLYYGIDRPDKRSSGSACYMSKHSIELLKLEPDETYNFMVRAEDIYGNTRESPVYSFSTDKNFKVKEKEQKTNSQVTMRLSSNIFRTENNYLIRLKATRPVSIEIATYDMPNFPLLKKMPNQAPADHPPLKSIYETSLLTCETCHQASSNNFSHPAHFRARLGANIPSEYPRLPNGQTNCLTCHFPHASNNQFHLRKPADRELCTGCHKRSFKNR